MQYALLIHSDEKVWAARSDAEKAAILAEHKAIQAALDAKTARIFGSALLPTSMSTTVRTVAGEKVVTDGPFAETAEHLGGFYVIDAADLDEALGYAKMLTAAVEIRPLVGQTP